MTLQSTNKGYVTNVVNKDTLRKYQLSVLDTLSDILSNSFGPFGSNTCIKKTDGPNKYTKDGYTILSNISFSGIIEEATRYDIETITRNIAMTVGDGTTSAVILSKFLFKSLLEKIKTNPEYTPAQIVNALNYVVSQIKEYIQKSAKEATIEDIYNIAYISSNGNDEISNIIKDIYTECGMSVFIDVAMSTAKETTIKYYDGMTLDTGYSDACFVTNSETNTAELDNPEIYFFEDPIDTKELGVFLDSIISKNILAPLQKKDYDHITPTVIVTPKISRDMSSLMDTLVAIQAQSPTTNKLPIIILPNVHQVTEMMDLARMCDAKPIRKYIDAEMYKQDVEKGLAPTPESIFDWAGTASQIIAYADKTKFINPYKMKNEDGSYSVEYNNLLDFLQKSLQKAIDEGEDAHTIGRLRRRIHSLKSNLVEIHAGGMDVADRESKRDLLEDAVKNCRSAAANGVGWASNFSGILATDEYISYLAADGNSPDWHINKQIVDCIYEAYYKLIETLYSHNAVTDPEHTLNEALHTKTAYDIRNRTFDTPPKSSIESDMIIMDSVAKIVGIMVTCNQFMTPNPQMNIYADFTEVN